MALDSPTLSTDFAGPHPSLPEMKVEVGGSAILSAWPTAPSIIITVLHVKGVSGSAPITARVGEASR
jgi:hypothetical protein